MTKDNIKEFEKLLAKKKYFHKDRENFDLDKSSLDDSSDIDTEVSSTVSKADRVEVPDHITEHVTERFGEPVVPDLVGVGLESAPETLDMHGHIDTSQLEEVASESLAAQLEKLSETETYDKEKFLGPNGFEAAVDAVDTDYWNSETMNNFDFNPLEMGGNHSNDAYEQLTLGQEQDVPVKQNNYRGEAGKLRVEKFGDYISNTVAGYDSADDVKPISESAHGALMHAAGVLMKYEAETSGEGIRVEHLDSEDAEEVVQAYTVVDSLLESEDWDQRTMMEQLIDEQKRLETLYSPDGNEYNISEL